MGNGSSSSGGEELLKKYWNRYESGRLRESQDNRFLKQCFFAYDVNKSGALEKEEAEAYINDLLSIGDLASNIRKEGANAGIDPEEYYKSYVQTIYSSMDVNQDGVIEFDELLKPKYDEVRDFFNAVSIRTLRAQKNPNAKKKKRSRKESARTKDKREGRKKKSREPSTKKSSRSKPKDDEFDLDSFEEWLPGDEAFEVAYEENTSSPSNKGRNALTQSGIVNLRSDTVSNISEIMGISSHKAQALLSRFKWDQQELLEAYYEDPDKVCNDIGITLEEEEIVIELPEELECSVCFDITSEYTYLPGCGHMFCDLCWGDFLSVNIREGNVTELKCMNQGCREIVGDNDIKKLVDGDLWKKYAQFLSNKFVDNSGTVKWCKRPGCTKAIAEPIVEGDNFIGVCSCGYKFCWKCGEVYHSPASCEQFESWNSKENSSELLNLKWMQQNTKQCPTCKNPIQKNDGCFQMTCSQCRSQWCWLCRQDWSTHSNHFQCSVYQDGTLQNTPEFRDGQTNNFFEEEDGDEQYLFFYERFEAYKVSEDYEKETHDKIERLLPLIKNENSLFDDQILWDAFEQLKLCREVIKNMFVALAFMEKDDPNYNTYHGYQSTLMIVTEKLGVVLDRELNETYITQEDWLVTIKKLCKVASKCVANMLDSEFA